MRFAWKVAPDWKNEWIFLFWMHQFSFGAHNFHLNKIFIVFQTYSLLILTLTLFFGVVSTTLTFSFVRITEMKETEWKKMQSKVASARTVSADHKTSFAAHHLSFRKQSFFISIQHKRFGHYFFFVFFRQIAKKGGK